MPRGANRAAALTNSQSWLHLPRRVCVLLPSKMARTSQSRKGIVRSVIFLPSPIHQGPGQPIGKAQRNRCCRALSRPRLRTIAGRLGLSVPQSEPRNFGSRGGACLRRLMSAGAIRGDRSLINAPWLSRLVRGGAFKIVVAVVRTSFVAAFFAGVSKMAGPHHCCGRRLAGPLRIAANAPARFAWLHLPRSGADGAFFFAFFVCLAGRASISFIGWAVCRKARAAMLAKPARGRSDGGWGVLRFQQASQKFGKRLARKCLDRSPISAIENTQGAVPFVLSIFNP